MIYVFYRVRGTESSILMYLCGGNIKRIKAHSVKWPRAAVRRVWVGVYRCECVCVWHACGAIFNCLKFSDCTFFSRAFSPSSFWAKTLALCNIFTSRQGEEREEKEGRKKGAERGVCRQQKLLIAQTHTHTHTRVLGPISKHTHTHTEGKAERRQSAAMATHKTS